MQHAEGEVGGGRTREVKLRQWFKNVVRYTLIAAADINGFIEAACETVDREELSEEGAAGTVDREYFIRWVREKLCPVLGRFDLREPRSVVVLDNASTHMCTEVIEAIENTGAVVLFSAPYSPELNPIENYFSVYKKYLKRHAKEMELNWSYVHLKALGSVDRDIGIKYFRHCGIPGADKVYTSDEMLQIQMQYHQLLTNLQV